MRTRLLTAAVAVVSVLTLAAPAAGAFPGHPVDHHCKGCPTAHLEHHCKGCPTDEPK